MQNLNFLSQNCILLITLNILNLCMALFCKSVWMQASANCINANAFDYYDRIKYGQVDKNSPSCLEKSLELWVWNVVDFEDVHALSILILFHQHHGVDQRIRGWQLRLWTETFTQTTSYSNNNINIHLLSAGCASEGQQGFCKSYEGTFKNSRRFKDQLKKI